MEWLIPLALKSWCINQPPRFPQWFSKLSLSSGWNIAIHPKECIYIKRTCFHVHISSLKFFRYISTLRSGSRYRPPFGSEILMRKPTWGGGRISCWNRNLEHPRFLLILPVIYTGIEPQRTRTKKNWCSRASHPYTLKVFSAHFNPKTADRI